MTELANNLNTLSTQFDKQNNEIKELFVNLENEKSRIFSEVQEGCSVINELSEDLSAKMKSKKVDFRNISERFSTSIGAFNNLMEQVEEGYETFNESLGELSVKLTSFDSIGLTLSEVTSMVNSHYRPKSFHKRVVSNTNNNISKISENSRILNKSMEKIRNKLTSQSKNKLLYRTKSVFNKDKVLSESQSLVNIQKDKEEPKFLITIKEIKAQLKKIEDKYLSSNNSAGSISHTIIKPTKLSDKTKYGMIKVSDKLKQSVHKREGSTGHPKHAEIKQKSTLEKMKHVKLFEMDMELVEDMLESLLSNWKKENEYSTVLKTEIDDLKLKLKEHMKTEIASDIERLKNTKQEKKEDNLKTRISLMRKKIGLTSFYLTSYKVQSSDRKRSEHSTRNEV